MLWNLKSLSDLTNLFLFIALLAALGSTYAAQKCHSCRGINCQRTSYGQTEACADTLDSCVTVYEGQMVLAQGCLEQLPVELRMKCQASLVNEQDTADTACQQCNGDLCNNVGTIGFECVQCNSATDENCRSNPGTLSAIQCPISRTANSYCFVKNENQGTMRGCATTLTEQKDCLNNANCMLCSPLEIPGCNGVPLARDDSGSGSGDGGTGSGSGDGGSGSGDGGSGSGSGSGDGGSGSGSGSGDGSSGSGSGSGDGNSGSGSGSGDGGSGSGSGSGDGGSNSGNGSGDGGSGSGSGSGDGGSNSGNGSGDGGSGSGSGSGDGGSDSGNGNGSGDGGSGSGSGSGDGDGGSGSGNGSGSGSGANESKLGLIATISTTFIVLSILKC